MATHDVERVGGVQIITGKTTYAELQIMPISEAEYVNGIQNRQGSIVSSGVRGLRPKKKPSK